LADLFSAPWIEGVQFSWAPTTKLELTEYLSS
jgi:hypothetical protein